MLLREFEGKALLTGMGLKVPTGALLLKDMSMDEMEEALRDVPDEGPQYVKAQVLSGGRGRNGAVVRTLCPEESIGSAVSMMDAGFKGETVNAVLVEQAFEKGQEMYLSLAIDPALRSPVLLASSSGGIHIEEVGQDSFKKLEIPIDGTIPDSIVKDVAETFDIPCRHLGRVLENLSAGFIRFDLTLIEINPMRFIEDEGLMALDAKIVVDENAFFRQPEMKDIAVSRLSPLERRACDAGITFLTFNGEIGVMGNGAGLTMATMDSIADHGGRTGVFIDLGGTDDEAMVRKSLELMYDASPKTVVINNFGGITKSDTVARAILEVRDARGHDLPIIARLSGNADEEARALLEGSGIIVATHIEDAARLAVELVSKERRSL